MADSIREDILQSFATQVAAITTGNGYDFTVATAARARRFFETGDLPAVGIFDGDEEGAIEYGDYLNTFQVTAEIHGDASATNRSAYANTLLANMKKGILSADTTHGGQALSTNYASSTMRIPDDDDDTVVSVEVTFAIQYHEVNGDPFSTP